MEKGMGIRCGNHIGEAHAPRCFDCDLAVVQESADVVAARLRGECPRHPGYPVSALIGCARCDREADR